MANEHHRPLSDGVRIMAGTMTGAYISSPKWEGHALARRLSVEVPALLVLVTSP
jgi:hypothetical protein